MTLDDELKAAKRKFTDATAAALAGDDSAWGRAEIHGKEVRRLQSEIRKRPAPGGEWGEMVRIREEGR